MGNIGVIMYKTIKLPIGAWAAKLHSRSCYFNNFSDFFQNSQKRTHKLRLVKTVNGF